MPVRLIFTAHRQVTYESFDSLPVGPHQARVRVISSLMSTGTENICFNGQYATGSHWDNWVKFPFKPGYLCVGEIVELGAEVNGWMLGDRVGIRMQHASEHVVDERVLQPLPQDSDLDEMAWFGLAQVGLMGARAADYRLGESVVIIGAGPIGQMSLRWAKANGAENVIVIDPVQMRLDMALRGGADHVLPISAAGAQDAIRAVNNGELPDVVADTTGHPALFEVALTLPRKYGRVALVGDVPDPSLQRLTNDVVLRGIKIAGGHMMHNDQGWSDARCHRLFLALHRAGRFSLSGLNTHKFLPQECEEAYHIANARRGETMGIVFDWTRS